MAGIKHRRSSFLYLSIFAAPFLIAGAAETAELRCPPEVVVDQKATDPPPGWGVSYNGFKAELASVTIFDGPPEQGASLVYDDEKNAPDTVTQIWSLPSNSRGYWMTCGYSNTAAQLSAQVPGDARRCEVVLERNVTFGDGRRPIRKAACSGAK